MNASQLKILHIEDDDGDAKVVSRACIKEFEPKYYTLVRVDSFNEGISHLKDDCYDLVLLDLNLGDGNGLNNMRAIKVSYPDIAIIVLTGYDDTDMAIEAVKAGAQEYIVKEHSNSRMLTMLIRSSIERKTYERNLFRLANQDDLTGLPNRRAFMTHMKQWLIRASRWKRRECVMFMDVNGFKQVNDSLGHDIGDYLLQQIASNIKSGLRASDMLARLAGDEFVVHLDLQSHETTETCIEIANKITSLFEKPLTVAGHEIKTSVSIGIAFFPDNGKDIDSLFHSADQAMYSAKQTKIPFVFAK